MSLYISSYIPIFLMIFINDMESIGFIQIKNTFLKNWIFWAIITVIILVCIVALWDFIKELKKTKNKNTPPVKLTDKEIKSHESEILNYFVTFLIPILTLDPTNWPSILSNAILIFLVGIYFVKNNLLSFNILLIILNFNIYKDQYSNIYITKASINEIKIKKLKAYQYNQTNIFFIPK